MFRRISATNVTRMGDATERQQQQHLKLQQALHRHQDEEQALMDAQQAAKQEQRAEFNQEHQELKLEQQRELEKLLSDQERKSRELRDSHERQLRNLGGQNGIEALKTKHLTEIQLQQSQFTEQKLELKKQQERAKRELIGDHQATERQMVQKQKLKQGELQNKHRSERQRMS